MNILAKIIPILLLYAAAAFAGTASTATTEKIADSALAKQESEAASQASITDSLAKKHAVWIKLEGDVEPSMFDFCARAIDDALKENPDYIVFDVEIVSFLLLNV